MNTEYKGFTIYHPAAANERFHIVPGHNFSPDGYSTLGSAKGAITKYENSMSGTSRDLTRRVVGKSAESDNPVQEAIAAAEVKGEDGYLAGITARSEQRAKAASSDDTDKASVPATTDPDGYKLTHEDNPVAALALGYGAPKGFNELRARFVKGEKLPRTVIAQILGFSAEQRKELLSAVITIPSRNKREGRFLAERFKK